MLKPITLGALALVAACAGQSNTVAYAAPGYLANGPAACKIRETRTPQGMRLEAQILADRSVYGDYDFIITAYNSGGSSDISQGGEVDLAAGERATVGSAEIPRGRYRAVLTLSDRRGPLCTIQRRS
jgi:hypothetical protein